MADLITGPTVTGPTCLSCPYFVAFKRQAAANQPVVDLTAPTEGDCREGPPRMQRLVVPDEQQGFRLQPFSTFSVTRSDWWCGKHPKRRLIGANGVT